MSDALSAGLLLKLDITVWTGSAALSAPDLGLDPASIAAHDTLGESVSSRSTPSIPSRASSATRATRSTA